MRWTIIFCLVACGPAAWAAAPSAGEASQRHQVNRTYNGRPFAYEIRPLGEADTHRLYRISYPSPVSTALEQNNTVPGDYYAPRTADGDALKRPAVVCLHILNGNFELERITCSTLAAHGIGAMMIKLPYYGERAPTAGPRAMLKDPKIFLGALPQGLEDVRRAVDVLASRSEINPRAIGLIGISLGGIVAATAAAEEPRIARAAFVLAGGDLAAIIGHARETRELRDFLARMPAADRRVVDAALARVDPLRQAARLRPRAEQGRVLMINAAEDEVIPPECTRRLAAALGLAERVHWLEGLGHYTAIAALPDMLREAVDFFAADLPADARPAPPAGPLQVVSRLAGQAALLCGADPREGRGHLVDLEAELTLADGKPVKAHVQLARGSGNRFRLEATVPSIGHVALGQGKYPWMLSLGRSVFKGVPAGPAGVDPFAGAQKEHLQKLRLVAGVLAAVAATPSIVEPLATLVDDSTPEEKALRIELKQSGRGAARLVLKADGRPARLELTAPRLRGVIRFRQWQIDTPASGVMFSEPAGSECREVDRADLERMFGALFNLAAESL